MHNLLRDGLVIVYQVDAVPFALAHLATAVESGNLYKLLPEIEGVRLREEFHAVHIVEAAGEDPCDFEVRLLVFPDRNPVGAVGEDVGCHKHRVSEKPGVYIVRIQTHFFLECGGSLKLADVRYHIQQDIKFADLRNVALHV